jgi:hypothetical protein
MSSLRANMDDHEIFAQVVAALLLLSTAASHGNSHNYNYPQRGIHLLLLLSAHARYSAFFVNEEPCGISGMDTSQLISLDLT